MLIIGLGSLYSLSNSSLFEKEADYLMRCSSQGNIVFTSKRWIVESFKRDGYITGVATLIYKNAPLFVIAYIILEIIASSWYSLFMYLGLGFISGAYIGRILVLLKVAPSNIDLSTFVMVLYSILTCAALYLLMAQYF
jgi:hypothetical protein